MEARGGTGESNQQKKERGQTDISFRNLVSSRYIDRVTGQLGS